MENIKYVAIIKGTNMTGEDTDYNLMYLKLGINGYEGGELGGKMYAFRKVVKTKEEACEIVGDTLFNKLLKEDFHQLQMELARWGVGRYSPLIWRRK